MKKVLLLLIATLLLVNAQMSAQDRMQHPISTARITGVDGRAELVFDEAITFGFSVRVLDLTGKVMFSQQHMASEEGCASMEIPLENLRKGIYMVQVIGNDGKTKTLKLQRN